MNPAAEVLEVLLKARSIALFGGGTRLAGAGAVGVVRPGAEDKHGSKGDDHEGTHGNLRYATLPIKTRKPAGFARRPKPTAPGCQWRSGDNSPRRSRRCWRPKPSPKWFALEVSPTCPEASPGFAPKAPWLS